MSLSDLVCSCLENAGIVEGKVQQRPALHPSTDVQGCDPATLLKANAVQDLCGVPTWAATPGFDTHRIKIAQCETSMSEAWPCLISVGRCISRGSHAQKRPTIVCRDVITCLVVVPLSRDYPTAQLTMFLSCQVSPSRICASE